MDKSPFRSQPFPPGTLDTSTVSVFLFWPNVHLIYTTVRLYAKCRLSRFPDPRCRDLGTWGYLWGWNLELGVGAKEERGRGRSKGTGTGNGDGTGPIEALSIPPQRVVRTRRWGTVSFFFPSMASSSSSPFLSFYSSDIKRGWCLHD